MRHRGASRGTDGTSGTSGDLAQPKLLFWIGKQCSWPTAYYLSIPSKLSKELQRCSVIEDSGVLLATRPCTTG